jgi:hypothetical protein
MLSRDDGGARGAGVAVRGEADLTGIKASVLRSCINREK